MGKKSKKIELLEKGAGIIHLKGYNNTGINEILEAAAVPKGSFYFYFKSKEDFGLELLDFFMDGKFIEAAEQCLNIPDIPYLDRLKTFFDCFLKHLEEVDYVGGCPIGNFALEMGDLNERFREKVSNAFREMGGQIVLFLEKAVENGELKKDFSLPDVADYILNSWEGVLMRMKVEKSSKPMHQFYRFVFGTILGKQ